MHDTRDSYYKIGCSKVPDYREKTLQAQKPSIELVAHKIMANHKDARRLEKDLHEKYTKKRIRGEWFKLSQLEILEIKALLNDQNLDLITQEKNIRDFASINELTVLSNLECLNSQMIEENIPQKSRFERLQREAQKQLEIFHNNDTNKSIKKEMLKIASSKNDKLIIGFNKKLKQALDFNPKLAKEEI